jgi:PAS domain-containing protein
VRKSGEETRERAEAAMRESEVRYRALFDHGSDGIFPDFRMLQRELLLIQHLLFACGHYIPFVYEIST